MDDSRFDSIAKSIAIPATSRRMALRAAAAAVLIAAGKASGVDAAACRPDRTICRQNGDCCSGVCGTADRYGRRYCGCGNAVACNGTCCAQGQSCIGLVCTNNSCFVAGTRVAMADGSSKLIEFIEAGDLVIGQHGNVNRVVGIERPALGERKLYSLNHGDPFVTAEHPFFTDAGWKSIDSTATAIENPALAVGRLQPGDSLVELLDMLVPALVSGREPVELKTHAIPLHTMAASTAAPWTTVYNLLLDGDHTYFANDLLVHNKA